jgi:protein gp37
MAENSAIEWCDHTFNPWTGCRAISPGCKNCYAERLTKRFGRDFSVHTPASEATWKLPLKWERNAEAFYAAHGRRQRVFCASMSDVFDNQAPTAWRIQLFNLIASTPSLDWLLLTKRIGNAADMIEMALMFGTVKPVAPWPWPNVWLGATVVTQDEADRDIPKLLTTPAAVRFVSIEPMLGAIDLTSVAWPAPPGHRVDVLRRGYWNKAGWLAMGPAAGLGEPRGGFTNHSDMPGRLDWVICGGESGPGARPMHPDWARSLRDQCAAAGTPFLFKQWGEYGPTWFESHRHLDFAAPPDPDGRMSIAGTLITVLRRTDGSSVEQLWPIQRHGKKVSGRLLDGRTHEEFPS